MKEKKKAIPILDMNPVARYMDGPVYKFHSGLPTRGVRAVNESFDTPEEAYARGREIITKYEQADPCGNMGVLLGVTLHDGKYRPVINTYHSNT
jgi:hypothetical protein